MLQASQDMPDLAKGIKDEDDLDKYISHDDMGCLEVTREDRENKNKAMSNLIEQMIQMHTPQLVTNIRLLSGKCQ